MSTINLLSLLHGTFHSFKESTYISFFVSLLPSCETSLNKIGNQENLHINGESLTYKMP